MSRGDRGRGGCWPGGTGSQGDRGNKRGHLPQSSIPDHRQSFVVRKEIVCASSISLLHTSAVTNYQLLTNICADCNYRRVQVDIRLLHKPL